jgi:hypothetical protein
LAWVVQHLQGFLVVLVLLLGLVCLEVAAV